MLTVNTTPSIIIHPAGPNVLAGSLVNLYVEASGTGPLRYQWRHETVVLAGATNVNLTLSSIQVSQQGNYDVVVWNDFGSLTSLVAVIEVQPLVPPTILVQPASGSVLAGSNLSFSVVSTSSYPVAYQWYRGVAPRH
jgi:hypothetical protein